MGLTSEVGLANVELVIIDEADVSLVCMIVLSDSVVLILSQIPISRKRLEHSCQTSVLLVNILSPSHLHYQLRLFPTGKTYVYVPLKNANAIPF